MLHVFIYSLVACFSIFFGMIVFFCFISGLVDLSDDYKIGIFKIIFSFFLTSSALAIASNYVDFSKVDAPKLNFPTPIFIYHA